MLNKNMLGFTPIHESALETSPELRRFSKWCTGTEFKVSHSVDGFTTGQYITGYEKNIDNIDVLILQARIMYGHLQQLQQM